MQRVLISVVGDKSRWFCLDIFIKIVIELDLPWIWARAWILFASWGIPTYFIYILINSYDSNYINTIFNRGDAKCLKLLLITT